MKSIFKKTILGTIILGLILSTVFSPFFSNKALANVSYSFSATSATESSINFEVIVQTQDATELTGINPLTIEYSINQDYSDSETITVPNFDEVQLVQNRIATAGGLTPSTTYYARLSNLSNASLSTTTAQTSAPGTTTQDPSSGETGGTSTLPPCALFSADTWGGCMARIIYYIFFVPTSFLFSLSGQLMDFSMAYTLNSANYGKTADGSSFVEKGWTITRDLSNILFIVMLMYIAINIILGRGADKKLLGTIILIGLVINFSLFFARVVIDASNILGKIFYDNMGIETNSEAYINNPWIGEGDKSISIAIVSNFNPQKLFSQAGTLKLNTKSGVTEEVSAPDAGPFIIITLIMSIINLFGMYIFFIVAFILIGRVIGLWLLMIFAPIAFISYIMPKSSSGVLKKMHYSQWWPELFKQSFLVPIFLFMLYLILLFVNTGFLKGFKTFDNTTTGGILDVIVPLIIITFLLKAAKDIATDMSGDIGKAFASAGSAALGATIGIATGGASMLGRASLGRAGTRLAESGKMKDMALSGNFLQRNFAKSVMSTGSAMSTGSYDLRGAKIAGKDLASTTGLKLGKVTGEGGYVKMREEQRKKDEADIKKYMVSPTESIQREVYQKQGNLTNLLRNHEDEYEKKKREVEDKRKALEDEKGGANAAVGTPERKKYEEAKDELDKAKNSLKTFKVTTGISGAEDDLRNAEKAVKQKERDRRAAYANVTQNEGLLKEMGQAIGENIGKGFTTGLGAGVAATAMGAGASVIAPGALTGLAIGGIAGVAGAAKKALTHSNTASQQASYNIRKGIKE